MLQLKEEMGENSHQMTNNNNNNNISNSQANQNNSTLLTSMVNSTGMAATTTNTITSNLSPTLSPTTMSTMPSISDLTGSNINQSYNDQTYLALKGTMNTSNGVTSNNNNNNSMSSNNNIINNNNSSQTMNGSPSSPVTMHPTAEYLSQLIKDKKQLQAFPNVFIHLERILDEEINRVRNSLFQLHCGKHSPLVLPEPEGNVVQMQEKVYVPIKDHPEYNFVGRILGPRGMTAKQLEIETGCKIMVRGRGSMRDKKKEDQNRGKPNWEHLNDELHVLITVEDTPNRAQLKIKRAIEEVKSLLIPVTEGEDELKKRQLMELAIINGTYRDSNAKASSGVLEPDATTAIRIAGLPFPLTTQTMQQGLNSTTRTLGHPFIISPHRIHVPTTTIMNGGAPPPLVTPAEAGLIYTPYDFHQYIASPLLAEYPMTAATDNIQSGTGKQRRTISANVRDHPYQRPST